MNLSAKINYSVKTNILILVISILFFQSTSFASPITETRVISQKNEKLLVQLLIDAKGEKVSIDVGSRLDHKLMNSAPPDFLEYLYTKISPNMLDKNKSVVYLLSRKHFKSTKFQVILKIFLGEEGPFMEKVDIDMTNISTPRRRKKKGKKRNLIGLSFSGEYRLASRDIKVGGTKVSAKTKLALFTVEKTFFKERFGLFLNLGSGILQLDNSVQFTSLNPSHTLTKYDGGRSFAIGGGLKGKIFEKKAIRLDIVGSVLSFNSEASSVTKKIITDKAESSWREYKADLLLTLSPVKFIKPYIGISYSIVAGEIKIAQTFGITASTTQTKSFDERNSFGIVVGSAFFPHERIKIILEGRLLNETGFTGRVGWMF